MSENWQQIKDIFALAAELPPGLREVFLREQCGGDEEIYDEVVSLLAASEETEQIIENDSFEAAKFFPAVKDYDTTVFGHYTVLREIGRGGMGAVFLAERNDGEFEQKVALKIIRQSFADAEIERYFRRERQILATLNHPNIARLLDGGVSAHGEPFLVMEFVEGEDLLVFCKRRELDIEARLRLFVKICRAVSYAHQNLVVHRDLKPSNVLINTDGEPKLLDFGLAKITEADVLLNVDQTQTNFRAFTPGYASPEQITGKNVSTASDVYSLGVIFYELLTGAKPFNFEGKSLEEIINTITRSEPERPSSFVIRPSSFSKNAFDKGQGTKDERRRTKRISADLDNIALKALQKELARRYQSVAEFAADIERHLHGLPVSARRSSVSYRATKFFRRNKIWVSAAFVVVLALISGLAIALWQAGEARKERDKAQQRFNDVRKLSNSLLFEITPKIERLQGSTEAREILVQRALEYLDNLASESQTDAELQSELASAYEKIGEVQGDSNKPSLNDYAGAIESYQKAQKIRLNLPPTPENRQLLAENYRRYAIVIFTQNNIKDSFDASLESLKIYENLRAENPGSFELAAAYVKTNLQYGTTFSIHNEFSKAIPIFEKSLRDLSDLDQTDRETLRLKAMTLAQYGNALSWDDRQPEAETQMTEAVRMIDELVESNPNDALILRDAYKIYDLASTIYEGIKNDVSLAFTQKLLQTANRAVEADPADLQAKSNLARAYSRRGICLINVQRLAEGISSLQTAQSKFFEIIKQEPKNYGYRRELALIYIRFGDAQIHQKHYAAAIENYRESADLLESLAAQDEKNKVVRRDLAQSLKSIGDAYRQMNEAGKAKSAYQKASEIFQNLIDQNALGEFDRKLYADVQTALQKL